MAAPGPAASSSQVRVVPPPSGAAVVVAERRPALRPRPGAIGPRGGGQVAVSFEPRRDARIACPSAGRVDPTATTTWPSAKGRMDPRGHRHVAVPRGGQVDLAVTAKWPFSGSKWTSQPRPSGRSPGPSGPRGHGQVTAPVAKWTPGRRPIGRHRNPPSPGAPVGGRRDPDPSYGVSATLREPSARVSMISKPRTASSRGRSWVKTTPGEMVPFSSSVSSSGM